MDNFVFKNWTVWCTECHAKKTRAQEPKRKTNNHKLGEDALVESLEYLHNRKPSNKNIVQFKNHNAAARLKELRAKALGGK